MTRNTKIPLRKKMALRTIAIGLATLLLSTSSFAEADDRFLLYDENGMSIRATLQFGFNAVRETDLFWSLSEGVTSGADYNPDKSWLETYIKPGLQFETEFDGGFDIYGRLSGVGAYTFGVDAFDEGQTGRILLEEAYLGTRIAIGSGATLDLSAGSRELRLGTGMLISDGASDGFERGALKFGPRRAWEVAGIARLTFEGLSGTAFYLDPRERPESDGENTLAGFDLRYDHEDGDFLGVTYINVLNSESPYPQVVPGTGLTVTTGAREDTETVSFYARTSPFGGILDGLTFSADAAYQWNDRINLEAWAGRAQVSYAFSDLPWRPVLTYGYQTFSGDDPNTVVQERFDPLYYDGSPSAWATGSKSAMLFINSNVQSHNLSLAMQPTPQDRITLRYAHVRVNELGSPVQFGQATRLDLTAGTGNVITGVTDAHLSDDFFVEYSRIISPNIFLTAGISAAIPGEGITSVFGNDPTWLGGFVNVVFNY